MVDLVSVLLPRRLSYVGVDSSRDSRARICQFTDVRAGGRRPQRSLFRQHATARRLRPLTTTDLVSRRRSHLRIPRPASLASPLDPPNRRRCAIVLKFRAAPQTASCGSAPLPPLSPTLLRPHSGPLRPSPVRPGPVSSAPATPQPRCSRPFLVHSSDCRQIKWPLLRIGWRRWVAFSPAFRTRLTRRLCNNAGPAAGMVSGETMEDGGRVGRRLGARSG